MTDSFRRYHPAVNACYYVLVLGFSMALRHPIAQAVSLLCALWYAIQWQAAGPALKLCLPILGLTVLTGALFSHEGATLLLTLPTGAVTLESLCYGLSSGVMLMTVYLWFISFNRVLSADRFLYLFGRHAPALSLILSMTLRFIPRFRQQLGAVAEAQRSIGRDVSQGKLWQRAKTAAVILSVMVTWALENAIDTADSMKSRGYGEPQRSSFAVYRFDRRDGAMLLWLLCCGAWLLAGSICGAFSFDYFPRIQGSALTPMALSVFPVFALVSATPAVINLLEDRKWKAIRSAM